MKKKYQILKVIDKSDNYGTKKNNIFDVPFRVLLTAKSGMGKTTVITNLILNPNFYFKDFDGDDIYIISPSLNNDEKLMVIAEEKEIPDSNLMNEYDESIVKAISRIACNGRHINLNLIVCVQAYSQASPVLRQNINGLIIFDTSKKNLDDIASENNFVFNKDSEFIACFRDNVKSKRDFMVINYTNEKKEMLLDKNFEPIDIEKYKKK